MSQLVKFNSTPSLLSVFENFWGNDLVNYDMLSKAKLPAVNVKDKDKYTRREFLSSSFTRLFSLPENIDESQIRGHYDDGVLYVTIPKVQEKVPEKKKIPLN